MTFGTAIGTAIGGALGSGIGSKLFGGSKPKSLSNSEYRTALRHENHEDTRYQYDLIGRQAPKYGIHPLVAAGISPPSVSGAGGTGYYSQDGSRIGESVGAAIGQAVGGRKEAAQQQEIHNLTKEKFRSEIAVNDSLAAKNAVSSHIALMAAGSAGNRASQKANQVQDTVPGAGIPMEDIKHEGTATAPLVLKSIDGKTITVPQDVSSVQTAEDMLGEVYSLMESAKRTWALSGKPTMEKGASRYGNAWRKAKEAYYRKFGYPSPYSKKQHMQFKKEMLRHRRY